jgi:hypothetical protein
LIIRQLNCFFRGGTYIINIIIFLNINQGGFLSKKGGGNGEKSEKKLMLGKKKLG